ncbi:hypothetical protein RJ639_043567 [Escallonia herrerae]|uniref:Tetratricopeptide repeat protein 5 OB fold domain-containing protein n=1 Tax=Escallonia herrerae TaxID=1293975 RepID=A0AA88WCE0_9ASTE|nr:hypothetical protein RJ639_043567 [Escallonia herrerae]
MSSQTRSSDNEAAADSMAEAARAADDLYNTIDTFFPQNPDDKISRLHKSPKSPSSSLIQFLQGRLDSTFSNVSGLWSGIGLGAIPVGWGRASPELENPEARVLKQSQGDIMFSFAEQRKLPVQRATHEFLTGKVLDALPDYRKEAEDHLSKAVKLNPSLADAWLCLGNCIWKKGDLHSAKNCFTLALNKGPNKKILCQLSMLERSMAQGKNLGADNQADIVEESVKHAKEAIALDVKDGNSWYNLGNAWHTCFFATGAWDHIKLLQSLKAYQNAEKDERMKSNPDLYFNCAAVNKYLENYERALSGFEAAALKDPGLNATVEVQKMVNLLDKIDNMLRGQVKPKRLASLTSSLPAVDYCTLAVNLFPPFRKSFFFLQVNPSYRRATVDRLLEGLNKKVAVAGKVLFFIKHENVTPLYYLMCDSNQICFVLSVYGIRSDAIKEGDQVTLLEPYYHNIDFSWKEKVCSDLLLFYQFKSIRVDFIEQLLVNAKSVSPHHAVRASIYAQHKP